MTAEATEGTLAQREGGRDFALGVHPVKRVCHRPGGLAALWWWDHLLGCQHLWLGGLFSVLHWLDQSSVTSVGGSIAFHTGSGAVKLRCLDIGRAGDPGHGFDPSSCS